MKKVYNFTTNMYEMIIEIVFFVFNYLKNINLIYNELYKLRRFFIWIK